MTPRLVDKSALTQRTRSTVAHAQIESYALEGVLATCHVIALEVLYSARNAQDYEQLHAGLRSLTWLPVDTAVQDRALEVQRGLARSGHHRLPIQDLLIAATAEIHDAVLVHYDHDFDTIAAITGQSARWVIPRGT